MMHRLVFEAHRLFVSLNLRIKDLLGPVTRVKKKKKKKMHRPYGRQYRRDIGGYLAHKKHPPRRTLQ